MAEGLHPSIDPKKLIHQPKDDSEKSFAFGIEDLDFAREGAYAEHAYIKQSEARGYAFDPNYRSGDGSTADSADRLGSEVMTAIIKKRAMELVPKASDERKEAVGQAAIKAVSIEYKKSRKRYQKWLTKEQARLDDEASALEEALIDFK